MDKAMQEAEAAAALAWANQETATLRRLLEGKYRQRYPLFNGVELPGDVGGDIGVYPLPGRQGCILLVVSRVTYGNVGSVTHMDVFLKTSGGIRLLEMKEGHQG